MDSKNADSLDSLLHDIRGCKYSLENILMSLTEEDHMIAENRNDWITILNKLRIASTNLISISKFIKDKRDTMNKTSILVPKHFSEDVDPELQEMTNNRISVFNQDVIPNILRTKLIPALEDEENKISLTAKEFEQNKTFDVIYFKEKIQFFGMLILKKKCFFRKIFLTFKI